VTESATFDVWVGGNSNASLHANFIVSQRGSDPGHSQLK
jgi:hypothetical protein